MVALNRRSEPRHRIAVVALVACSVSLLFAVYSVLPIWVAPQAASQAAPSLAAPSPAATSSATLSPAALAVPTKLASPYVDTRLGPHWHGFSSLRQFMVFGDSWSSTGFDLDGDAPSSDNPMGNPVWPGHPVTNGANWAEYLTERLNESVIFTADFAVGGATVDSTLIKQTDMPEYFLRSLKVQVEEEWVNYTRLEWTAETSLFSIWIGVNDITASTAETRANFGKEFEAFADIMDQLYAGGARNFIMFNAPPLERAPIAMQEDPNGEWPELISEWNANVTSLMYDFRAKYNDSTTFLFDAWKLFDAVMKEPCLFEETCGFEEMTKACQQYLFGTIEPDYHDPACPYAVDKYFWINALHPSTRTHNMTAKAVYNALTAG